jgi:hypothetical protein
LRTGDIQDPHLALVWTSSHRATEGAAVMKTLTLIAGFAALSGTPVFAADMAVKAPPPAVVPASIPDSRTGIYLDADVGWGNFIPATISGECQRQRGHYLGQVNGEI